MEYTIKFNDGLSLFPVSLFVKVSEIVELQDVWNSIIQENIGDVILYGKIKENLENLLFLNSRLISNRIHVSTIINEIDQQIIETLISTKLIVFFNSDLKNSTNFKFSVNILANLSQQDIIIISPKTVKELVFMRQYFLEHKIKAKIMINHSTVHFFVVDTLLQEKIYDIDLYKGGLYV